MGLIFQLCVGFLQVLANILGITYQEISVIFNIYLQGVVLFAFALWLMIKMCLNIHVNGWSWTNGCSLTFALGQIVFVIIGVLRYLPPLNDSFYRCVHDLEDLAAITHTSYVFVNLIIFIVFYLVAIGIDYFVGRGK